MRQDIPGALVREGFSQDLHSLFLWQPDALLKVEEVPGVVLRLDLLKLRVCRAPIGLGKVLQACVGIILVHVAVQEGFDL